MRLKKEGDEMDKIYTAGVIFLILFLITSAVIYRIKYRIPNANNKTVNLKNITTDGSATAWDIIKPVTQNDHTLGSPNADLTLIIYYDTRDLYGKDYYEITGNIIDTYGKNGILRLIYRPFPDKRSHPTASKEAEASECVAEIGGNSKFWQYLDILFNGDPPEATNLTEELAVRADYIGINKEIFKTCLDGGKHAGLVNQGIAEAQNAGSNSTPFSLLIDSKGKMLPLPGVVSYQQLEDLIKTIKRSSP